METSVVEQPAVTNESKLPRAQKMIEPDPRDIVTVLYPPTLDGSVAAWVVFKAGRKYQIPLVFIESQNGVDDLTNRHVILLGRAENHMDTWLPKVKSALLVDNDARDVPPAVALPAHSDPLPFRKWEREMPYKVVSMTPPGYTLGVVPASGHSLALKTYEFFNADRLGFEKRPRIVDAVADFSTGARKFKDAEALCQCLDSYPFDLHTMDKLADAMELHEKRELMVAAGQSILRYRSKHGL